MKKSILWAFFTVLLIVMLFSLGSEPVNTVPNDVSVQSKFYTQSNANVRSCPSTSCDTLDTLSANTELSLPYATYNDLPEWIEVYPKDSGNATKVAYIHRSTLGVSSVETASEVTAFQPPQVEEQPIVNKQSCLIKAEFEADRAWMRACNLKGLITYGCQQLFDSQGAYIPARDPNFFGIEHFGEAMTRYLNDKATCTCTLPIELANTLNNASAAAYKSCEFYPNASY